MSTWQDLKGLDEAALKARLGELDRELVQARFQLALGELRDTTQLRKLRRTIARVQTALRQQA